MEILIAAQYLSIVIVTLFTLLTLQLRMVWMVLDNPCLIDGIINLPPSWWCACLQIHFLAMVTSYLSLPPELFLRQPWRQ